VRLAPLLFALALLGAVARADEPAPERNSGSRFSTELRLEVPFALKRFGAAPEGFTPTNLEPPIALGGEFRFPFNPGNDVFRVGGWGDVSLALVRPLQFPMGGFGAGVSFGWLGVEADLGIDTRFQNWLDAPYKQSAYGLFWYSPLWLRVRYPTARISPGLSVEAIEAPKAQIANFEGLATSIAHDTTWLFSPNVEISLPLGLAASGSLDIFSLGATAIASKEFALALEKRTVVRYTIGLGARFKEWELWAHAAFLENVGDETEHEYRAPFLYRPYLLAPQTLTLEAKWRL
jgi:hypothetical protein